MPGLSVQILGIRFFNGTAEEAVDEMQKNGGFLIAPSGTCFARLRRDPAYRDATATADIALPDSGAMVLLWSWMRGEKLQRISGLKYLQRLCNALRRAKETRVLWVVPNELSESKTSSWLAANGFGSSPPNLYVAPFYGSVVEDRQLCARIEANRPDHVIVGIGSGPQEKLGYFLRESLSYRPAIHCIGAALGFLTGEQVKIPDWADRLYLGWLFRLVTQPGIFIPRLTRALELPWLISRFGTDLPPLKGRQ